MRVFYEFPRQKNSLTHFMMAADELSTTVVFQRFMFNRGINEYDAFMTQLAVSTAPPLDEGELLSRLDAARRWFRNNYTPLYAGIDDQKAAGSPRTPAATGPLATALDLLAYLWAPDDAEWLVFGFEISDFAKNERRSAKKLYINALDEVIQELASEETVQSVTDQERDDLLTAVADEIKSVHDEMQPKLANFVKEVARSMAQDAIKRGALPRTASDVASTTWDDAYKNISPRAWSTAEELQATRRVFSAFVDTYLSQRNAGAVVTFDSVYNQLPTKSARKLLALSTWLVPYDGKRGRPEQGTRGWSSFFAQVDGRKTLLKILQQDPSLEGNRLNKTISFVQ